jgi:hypothetical protein
VFKPRRVLLAEGIRVEVDGADDELSILVEAWAHQRSPKVAQKRKVLADALKLLPVAASLPVAPRLVLCQRSPRSARWRRTGPERLIAVLPVAEVLVPAPRPARRLDVPFGVVRLPLGAA